MQHLDDIEKKAKAAVDKKALFGDDLDLAQYDRSFVPHKYLADQEMCALPQDEQQRMLMSGLDVTGKGRGGTYVQKDTTVIHCHSMQDGVEVLPAKAALEKYDWVKDYFWKLVAPDQDKYTASAALELHDGYVIRALPGSKSIYPIQACLYIEKENLQQNVHNLIVVEEGAELHVITGCATSPTMKKGVHVGISEFFVKKNAKLSFTMIHNWAEEMDVRPRSVARVEEGGVFINNYICMKPVRSIQMYPVTYLAGENSTAMFYSIIVGTPGSNFDVGGRTFLQKPGCRAEIIQRAISNGAHVMNRGHLIGEAPGIKAHLECKGLLLNGGVIDSVPQLSAHVEGVDMSHEAAVGKVAQEEIHYLMSRGLSESESISTIVRGFLNIDIMGLPPMLKAEIDKAIDMSDKDAL
ncbi:MAG: SufD family Fe-S cluster assembly protein [Syntrophobacteraceae bacterium]|nr:SufD family Fe-S cluster assembly protein [Syntrophobacteraceae bacterium]